jgi:hypothetical protein
MTRPASSRVMLIEDRRGGASGVQGTAPVRRYRIARLRLDAPSETGEKRFEYLKRSYA